MAVKKRNTEKPEEETTTKKVEATSEKKEVKAPAKQCNSSCNGCSCFKSLLVFVISFCCVICGFAFYLKQYQPELYAERIEALLPTFQQQYPKTQTTQSSDATASAITTASATTTSNPEKLVEEVFEKKLNINDLDDAINLEEKAFLRNAMKEEEIYEKIKDRPELLRVKQYYDEPIGQMVKRISLEEQVVLFINSNDERSKVTRLAISQAKVPFGVMEVDNEPRGNEIRSALFRMTSQRTFPFIFVNGEFFGNSYALQRAMQNGEFYELVDSEVNKKNWLLEKEEYHQKILKRKKAKWRKRKKKVRKN